MTDESDITTTPQRKHPRYVRTIKREHCKLSVLARFYLSILVWTGAIATTMVIFCLISSTNWGIFSHPIIWYVIIGLGLFMAFVNKGSLVEEVKVDYPHEKIIIRRYRLWGKKVCEEIAFDNFSWDIAPVARGFDRYRLHRKKGHRIVIVDSVLGWGTATGKLDSALRRIQAPDSFWDWGF